MPPLIDLLRPHQWIKNGFVLAPLLLTPDAVTWTSALLVVLAALAFCAASSAVYVLNDYIDRECDRRHPEKRLRPLAAGTVSEGLALKTGAALGLGALLVAALLSGHFLLILVVYVVQSILYCFWLKNFAIIDVLVLAFGFVLRVLAGAALIGVQPSDWILICTGLLALFLAVAKRRDDIVRSLGDDFRASLKGYNRPLVDTALSLTLTALLLSYLIYTTDADVQATYRTDKLFLTAPFVLAGVLRYLQITLVEERSGSPTRIVLTDRFMFATILGWIATFALLVYQ